MERKVKTFVPSNSVTWTTRYMMSVGGKSGECIGMIVSL